MANKEKSATGHIVGKVFSAVLVLVVALGVLAYLQARDIERGILEVCATQQDGYVQLVLDQINLKENRDDEEIISDILETMDASSNKYWVFSRDQTMLFVKDVTETNRYKGFSAATYWGTQDAQAFLDSLQVGTVSHDFLRLNDVEYLASGSVFVYGGRDYRLCLLTNRSALLDNNDYLGARSRLLVIMLVALGLLVIIPLWLAFGLARSRKREAALNERVAQLSVRLQDASERLAHADLYDTRRHVWSVDAFGPFVQKLMERGAGAARLAQVVCADAAAADAFIERAVVLLDEKIVRFRMADSIVVLLFPSGDDTAIRRAIEPLLSDDASLGEIVPIEN